MLCQVALFHLTICSDGLALHQHQVRLCRIRIQGARIANHDVNGGEPFEIKRGRLATDLAELRFLDKPGMT